MAGFVNNIARMFRKVPRDYGVVVVVVVNVVERGTTGGGFDGRPRSCSKRFRRKISSTSVDRSGTEDNPTSNNAVHIEIVVD